MLILNPAGGSIYSSQHTVSLNLKKDFLEFSNYIQKKRYSYRHERKLILFGKKLSYCDYFNYLTILKNKEDLRGDGFYKASRAIITFYKEKYFDNDELHRDLDRIKKLITKAKSTPDIYTPTVQEVVNSVNKLMSINRKYSLFYLGLALSGVRIVELESACNKTTQYRVVQKEKYNKILINKTRNTKTAYYIYLPKDYVVPTAVSLGFFQRLLMKHKNIVRPKYLRNFFYSACVELGISTAIADFYQGRTPITMGNKHYLEKEYHADREYKRLLEYFESVFIK